MNQTTINLQIIEILQDMIVVDSSLINAMLVTCGVILFIAIMLTIAFVKIDNNRKMIKSIMNSKYGKEIKKK